MKTESPADELPDNVLRDIVRGVGGVAALVCRRWSRLSWRGEDLASRLELLRRPRRFDASWLLAVEALPTVADRAAVLDSMTTLVALVSGKSDLVGCLVRLAARSARAGCDRVFAHLLHALGEHAQAAPGLLEAAAAGGPGSLRALLSARGVADAPLRAKAAHAALVAVLRTSPPEGGRSRAEATVAWLLDTAEPACRAGLWSDVWSACGDGSGGAEAGDWRREAAAAMLADGAAVRPAVQGATRADDLDAIERACGADALSAAVRSPGVREALVRRAVKEGGPAGAALLLRAAAVAGGAPAADDAAVDAAVAVAVTRDLDADVLAALGSAGLGRLPSRQLKTLLRRALRRTDRAAVATVLAALPPATARAYVAGTLAQHCDARCWDVYGCLRSAAEDAGVHVTEADAPTICLEWGDGDGAAAGGGGSGGSSSGGDDPIFCASPLS
jgi:hypothetical protein